MTLKPGLTRFYETAAAEPRDGGFAIALDGRPVRTPAGRPLELPTRALADDVAREWADQGEKIDPGTMPFTKMANTALDGVADRPVEVAEDIVRYAGTDLLCYRADAPEALRSRQDAAWAPLLDWAESRLGHGFAVTAGVIAVDQPPETLNAARAALSGLDPFALVSAHRLTTLSTSYVLMLAVVEGRLGAAEAFDLSRIDETYQQEYWGIDAEAEARAQTIRSEMILSETFLARLRA